MTSRITTMFTLLLVLLVLRFIYVPWVDWQQQTKGSIYLDAVKLSKSQSVIQNRDEYEQRLTKLSEFYKKQKSMLFSSQSESAFQLSRQQQVERLINESNLRINRIGWSSAIPVVGSGIKQYTAQISIEGQIEDILKWHIKLEQQEPAIVVKNFSLRFDRQTANNLGRGQIELELQFFSSSEEVVE